MPKLRNRLPSYRLHKASGQAVVTLNGQDVYLGCYDTAESRGEYERVLKEWLTNHRPISLNSASATRADLTLNEIFVAYWEFVAQYYQKYGKVTSEVPSIKRALTPLLRLYGRHPASTFGPLAFKAYRQTLIDAGLARGVINNHVGRAKRFFKWATENEMVPPAVYHGLQAVAGLRRGRSAAPESMPVRPVPDSEVEAVLRHVSRHVAAMIQLQRLTGMRPGEVLLMRAADLDTTGKIWLYKPQNHKTEHHDRERFIYLGPQAQQVVKPFLTGNVSLYLFSPKRALEEHRAWLRANRKTPLTPSQRQPKRASSPRRRPGERYTIGSYEHAIKRGCDKAYPVPDGLSEADAGVWRRKHRWAPNQLRHNAATFLRKQFGIEAARVVLGHRSAEITEIYAELDYQKAAEIMGRVG